MGKIEKCPFCGRYAELRHDKDGFSYVLCANDGCYVRTDGHLNEESAIKAWNNRKPMERIVERLEEAKSDWNDDYNVPIKKAIEIVKEEGGMNG